MLSYHVVCKRIDGKVCYLAPSGKWIKSKSSAACWNKPEMAKERAQQVNGFIGVGHHYKY